METNALFLEKISCLRDEDSTRYDCHGIFPYPAMMVPRFQGALMDELLQLLPDGATIYDPFMGSGTVLSESLSRGLDFYGTDINPLSLLCCEVKSDYFDYKISHEGLAQIIDGTCNSDFKVSPISFSGSDKWFPEEVISMLTVIRNEIMKVEESWCRRLFWLSLSEVVRKFSRTRLSTYKLHVDKSYSSPKISEIKEAFIQICMRNIQLKRESWSSLGDRGYLRKGSPTSNVFLELTDARCSSMDFKADLVVTSPPYGDNQTTVTYGQFSYLPLQFIDLNDIDQRFDRSITSNASSIDSASLGGSLKNWREKLSYIEFRSESFREAVYFLKGVGRGGESRLSAFTYDLYQALLGIARHVKPDGYWMMTLGNRKINGVPIPLDSIASELLRGLGFSDVVAINRRIGKKRMAGSMSTEKIVIMRKGKK